MRDEKEERKKQARSNKQTRQSNTAYPRQSLFRAASGRTRTHDTLCSRQSALPLSYQGSSAGWAQISHVYVPTKPTAPVLKAGAVGSRCPLLYMFVCLGYGWVGYFTFLFFPFQCAMHMYFHVTFTTSHNTVHVQVLHNYVYCIFTVVHCMQCNYSYYREVYTCICQFIHAYTLYIGCIYVCTSIVQ